MAIQTGLMETMTWEEAAEAARDGLPVVLPIGSTEQHGPHLPLGTDCYIPEGLALEACKRIPLVVAPPVRYGAKSRALSGGGETFPGTISLNATTLITSIGEILGGLARSGFTQLCLYNWHYENAGTLWEAADLAHQRYPDIKVLVIENALPNFSQEDLSVLYPNGFPGLDIEHASIMETAMMMVLRPDLVHTDRIADDGAERHPSWDVVPAPPEFIPRSGVLWHPSEATEEIGRRFVSLCVDRLVDALTAELGRKNENS